MPKNNKGKNAFFFFMLDWKRREEHRGRKFPNGLREVQADPGCTEEWKNLSKQQRGPYEAEAKRNKVTAQMTDSGKKTTRGFLLQEVDDAEEENQNFLVEMNNFIDELIVMNIENRLLSTKHFYLIHTNWYFSKESSFNKNEYFPAEFAIAEFSLKDGIKNLYHEIIKPKIPLGYMRTAMSCCQQNHGIPPDGELGSSDLQSMYQKICTFAKISPGRKVPIYTDRKCFDAVKCLLEKLCFSADIEEDYFIVYSLETLFVKMRNYLAIAREEPSVPDTLVIHELNKDLYYYNEPGSTCEVHNLYTPVNFHNNCSVNVVRRWIFTMCDNCCKYLDLELIPGIHCPKPESKTSDTGITDEMRKSFTASNPFSNKLSMTGVSQEYRERVSELTYEEKQRKKKNTPKVQVIDHSKKFQTESKSRENDRLTYASSTSSSSTSSKSSTYESEFPTLRGKMAAFPGNMSGARSKKN